jgi:endonuclease/exonuclease/phosphatase family metal-dependent hydrolase
VELRVMSFNIRHGRAPDGKNRWYRRRELVFDVIRGHAPHVAGLQEANPVQLDELLTALPSYGSVADRPYGGRLGSYAAILFDTGSLEPERSGDFWLSPDPDGQRARAWDADVARICTWGVFVHRDTRHRFVVFNTHFDQRGQIARVESARLVVDRLERFAHLPRIVCGDLNAKPDTPPLDVLRAAGFRDTYTGDQKTFHGFKDVKSIGRVDHILCDDGWTVTDAAVLTEEGPFSSDHFAITATLEEVPKNRK